MADITHHQATINHINMHYAEQGDGMAVVLCHGFPHTWYSWHRQMPALAEAGYRVIAPDMRGMGATSAPEAKEAYSVKEITADLVGLLDHLAIDKAVFAGLDFGAFAVYDLAQLHPQRMIGVIGLENPAAPHDPKEAPLVGYARMAKEHFLHIDYFRQPPTADNSLNSHPREFLSKVFYALSGDYDYVEIMRQPAGISYLEALPEPPPLPWSWLSEEDLDVYVAAYKKSGFTGGLNWYRSMDIKWQERKAFEGRKSSVPAWFIGSENDVDLKLFHGDDPISLFSAQFSDVREIQMIKGAGHLMQLECADKANQILLKYLKDM